MGHIEFFGEEIEVSRSRGDNGAEIGSTECKSCRKADGKIKYNSKNPLLLTAISTFGSSIVIQQVRKTSRWTQRIPTSVICSLVLHTSPALTRLNNIALTRS